MLTKIGIAALLGTIGTAAIGGVANAQEFVPPPNTSVAVVAPVPVTVAAPPVVTTVDYHYGYAGGYGRPGVYYRDGWRGERVVRRDHDRREWRRDGRRDWR